MTPRRVQNRHAKHLRALAGEWRFEALQIDGSDTPAATLAHSKLLLDGDRFRMVSPEATYDGRFRIDPSTKPMHIDIDFVEGPEAGNRSCGVFQLDGDRLTICLGLVGASRPTGFMTQPGSRHALERLRRTSLLPPRVSGGETPMTEKKAKAAKPTKHAPKTTVDPAGFAVESSPMLDRLQGTWLPVRLVTGSEEMRADWLPFGSRITVRNEAKVVFGGQIMLHVKLRIDESVTPTAVDYLHLHGRDAGKISKGIMQWIGGEVCFLIAAPGDDRPTDFSRSGPGLTLSQWTRTDARSAR